MGNLPAPSEMHSLIEQALLDAYGMLGWLGDRALGIGPENPHGEQSILGDAACELVMAQALWQRGIRARIVSEEIGDGCRLFSGSEPADAIVLMDGIDGTSVFKKRAENPAGRATSMIAVLAGDDPRYADYVAAGVVEHCSGRIISAAKGLGCYVRQQSITTRVQEASGEERLSGESVVYVDTPFPVILERFGARLERLGIAYRDIASLSCHFVDVALGEAALSLAAVRKMNLEPAIMYGILREAGCATYRVTEDGVEDLAGLRYLEHCRADNELLIGARSLRQVEQLISV